MKLKRGSQLRRYGLSYVLAQIFPNQCCLVEVETGNRWVEPILVKTVLSLEKEEVEGLLGPTCLSEWQVFVDGELLSLADVLENYEDPVFYGVLRVARDYQGEPVILSETLSKQKIRGVAGLLYCFCPDNLGAEEIVDLTVRVETEDGVPVIKELSRATVLS